MECIDLRGWTSTAQEHAMRPRNLGPLEECTGWGRITGPCGDTMEFWIAVRDGRVERVRFVTDGCGSSRACGSMTTTLAEGKSVEAAAAIGQQDILDALGEGFAEEHCALLAANTLKAACADHWRRRDGEAGGNGS